MPFGSAARYGRSETLWPGAIIQRRILFDRGKRADLKPNGPTLLRQSPHGGLSILWLGQMRTFPFSFPPQSPPLRSVCLCIMNERLAFGVVDCELMIYIILPKGGDCV